MRLRYAAILGLMLLAAESTPGEVVVFVVVAHPQVEATSISRTELSKIFLKRLRVWRDGEMAVPVDQVPDSSVRQAFTRWVHERSVVSIEIFWKRMILSGRAVPPPELNGDEEVLDFVRSTPGAVGYVRDTASVSGLRVLVLTD